MCKNYGSGISYLNGLVMAVGSLGQEGNVSQLLKKLTDRLNGQGALVVNTSDKSSFRKLKRVMKIPFVLNFKDKKDDSDRQKIHVFYSLRKREESLNLINSFIKALLKNTPAFEWEVCNFGDVLFNLKYVNIYASALPTLFFEMVNFKPEDQEVLQKVICQALSEDYGTYPLVEQTAGVNTKPQLAKTVKKQKTKRKQKKKKQKPWLLPPEGPSFQFNSSTEREFVYPFSPPEDK